MVAFETCERFRICDRCRIHEPAPQRYGKIPSGTLPVNPNRYLAIPRFLKVRERERELKIISFSEIEWF